MITTLSLTSILTVPMSLLDISHSGRPVLYCVKMFSGLMKDGENNIIEEYSKALLKELKKVEDYIKKIMGDTENYTYLCKHILAPGK